MTFGGRTHATADTANTYSAIQEHPEHAASCVHTDVCVSELLAGSYRGQANPAPVFSAVKQLEARKLLTSSGENVFWHSSSFTLYLAAAHSAPPPLTRSTWQPPPHAFTPPPTSTHTHVRTLICVCAQALLLLLLYICADGKNQATQQERAGVIQGIIYVEKPRCRRVISKAFPLQSD